MCHDFVQQSQLLLSRSTQAWPALPTPQSTSIVDIRGASYRIHLIDRTPIFICALDNCYRLFSSRDRVMTHRKRDHDTEDQEEIITWNE